MPLLSDEAITDVAERHWRAFWPEEVARLEQLGLLDKELATTARLVRLRIKLLVHRGSMIGAAQLMAVDELVMKGPLSASPVDQDS